MKLLVPEGSEIVATRKAAGKDEARLAVLVRTPPPPFLLNREDAAKHLGIGVVYFDGMVRDGELPKPILVGGSKRRRPVKRWRRDQLEAAVVEANELEDGAQEWAA